ncbi:hypothetical protein [Demequina soli]|uniref:hypothetical protein n=1 Tax=Demequina soli TaxID=1638987 RepID=UPI000782CB67|nr:hypothetical protein [Demequina soli]
MRTARLLREAWRAAVAARVMSALVLLVVAAALVSAALTSGRAEVAAARVADELDSPEFRVTVVSTESAVTISRLALETYAARSDVDVVVAVGDAVDMRPTVLGGGGAPVPVREVALAGAEPTLIAFPGGGLPGLYMPSSGRDVAIREYARRDGVGIPVAGTYRADATAFTSLAGSGLVLDDDEPIEARAVYVLAPSPALAARHALDAPALFGEAATQVSTTAGSLESHEAIRVEVDRFSRYLVLALAGGGAALIGIIVVVWTLLRQRDLGRRRALGATRTTIVAIATAQVGLLAVGGTMVAMVTLGIGAAADAVSAPSVTYQLAIGWLLIVAASAATAVPSWVLSLRDPVRVLRQP